MRVLIIDNKIDADSQGSGDLRRMVLKHPGATVYVRRGPDDDLPRNLSFFDKIIVSGSKTSAMESAPWIDRLHELIKRAIDLNKPFLGVCYGHQALVRALGGLETVGKSEKPELGWTKISITEPSKLLSDLPESFYSFSWHFEEVRALPAGLRKLARSEGCEIQACEVAGKPIYGIQFHPEKTLEEAKSSLKNQKQTVGSEKNHNDVVGEKIFQNFLKL